MHLRLYQPLCINSQCVNNVSVNKCKEKQQGKYLTRKGQWKQAGKMLCQYLTQPVFMLDLLLRLNEALLRNGE